MKRVLVTGSDGSGKLSWRSIRFLLYLNGLEAVRATPSKHTLKEPFDALIVAGGADVHPSWYGDQPRVKTRFEEDRDQMEWEYIGQAFKSSKPILGICRGMQLLNVYFGGNLHQEVSRVFDDFLPPTNLLGKILARHVVTIEKDSHVFHVVGATEAKVNSLHHQAVHQVGDGLKITARLKNGMTQAIEHLEHPWLVGVQWHPELMIFNRGQRNFFSQEIYGSIPKSI